MSGNIILQFANVFRMATFFLIETCIETQAIKAEIDPENKCLNNWNTKA